MHIPSASGNKACHALPPPSLPFRQLPLLMLCLLSLMTGAAGAADIFVDPGANGDIAVDGLCSVDEAIQAANSDAAANECPAGLGDDVIHLPADTIVLSQPLPNVVGGLEIVGEGPGASVISGDNLVRPLTLESGYLILRDLTVQEGFSPEGGAIFNQSGTELWLYNTELLYNSAESFGGGIYSDGWVKLYENSRVCFNQAVNPAGQAGGGGIYLSEFADGLIMEYSTLCDNLAHTEIADAKSRGGGIYAAPGFIGSLDIGQDSVIINNQATATVPYPTSSSEGGGIYFSGDGSLTLNSARLENNSADVGGGLFGMMQFNIGASQFIGNQANVRGGGAYIAPLLSVGIDNSLFQGNAATLEGGGIFTDAGSITTGTLGLSNSSLVDNQAGNGGALYSVGSTDSVYVTQSTLSGNTASDAGGAIYSLGSVQLLFSTITRNQALNSAGGVYHSGGFFSAEHGILADNDAATAPDFIGTLTSNGYNLIGDAGGTPSNIGDQFGVTDPRLGPLQDNGGGMPTHLPYPDSPAVDAGLPGLTSAPIYDQRGSPFFRINNGVIDIGALETEPNQAPVLNTDVDLALPAEFEDVPDPDGISVEGLLNSVPEGVEFRHELNSSLFSGTDYYLRYDLIGGAVWPAALSGSDLQILDCSGTPVYGTPLAGGSGNDYVIFAVTPPGDCQPNAQVSLPIYDNTFAEQLVDFGGSATVDYRLYDNQADAMNGTATGPGFLSGLIDIPYAPLFVDVIEDGNLGASEGIAVIDADNTNGVWEYSLNNGGDWDPFGAPADAFARLLAADGLTRIRFIPAPDFNGSVDPGISFRAWDQSQGRSNGDIADASINGGNTAFSVGTQTASIDILPVNDPPTFSHLGDQNHPGGLTGTQSVPGWAYDFIFGPPDEQAFQDALAFHTTINDPDNVLVSGSLSIALDGTLSYELSGSPGSAQVGVILQDNGGVLNGGVDASPLEWFFINMGPLPLLEIILDGAGSGTVTSTPAGLNCGADCLASFPTGETVTLEATPAPDSLFLGWGIACPATTTTSTVVMDSDKSCVATFGLKPHYMLDVSKTGAGGGTVVDSAGAIDCGAQCDADFIDGSNVSLQALPDANSVFAGWSGDCVATTIASATVLMNADKSCIARFDPLLMELSVSLFGTGDGGVTSSPAGIDCGSQCNASFAHDSLITLTATPSPGSTFQGWDGDCGGYQTSIRLLMDTTKSCSARFDEVGPQPPRYFSLSLNKTGDGEGQIVSEPSGIDCGGDCDDYFVENHQVQLTATPEPGSVFSGWSGDCAGADPDVSLVMDSHKICEAMFASISPDTVALTLSLGGAGSGTVTSDPSGLDCGSDCEASFQRDASVTLNALPDSGSLFSGWAGDCAGADPQISLIMDEPKACEALFAPVLPDTVGLSVSLDGDGHGSVTSDPPGVDCGPDCSADFELNSLVTLEAVADNQSRFIGWQGDCSGSTSMTELLMDADKSCAALFGLDSSQGLRVVEGSTPISQGSRVDYPTLTPGQSAEKYFVVENLGTEDLVLHTLPYFEVNGIGFEVAEGYSPLPYTVPPGEQVAFTLTFYNGTPGRYETNVLVEHNLSTEPFVFSVAGEVKEDLARYPLLEVYQAGVELADGDSVDFGETLVRQSVIRQFILRNPGHATLRVDSPRVPDGFELVNFPESVPPGDEADFSVILTAGTVGQYMGLLSFDSNVAGVEAFSVRLRGRVSAPVRPQPETHPPEDILLSHQSIREQLEPGELIGEFSAVDPDNPEDSHGFALVGGSEDNQAFSIEGNLLLSARSFDYAEQDRYEIRVRVTDSQDHSLEKIFAIQILEGENHPPTDILLSRNSVPENRPAGTAVGVLRTVDPDEDDSHRYLLVGGDSGAFFIAEDVLFTAERFDYEARNSFFIEVETLDSRDQGFTKGFDIHVTPQTVLGDTLSAGWKSACARGALDNRVSCWGWNNFGQGEAPDNLGPVSDLDSGGSHNCAIIEQGRLRCWGNNQSGQTHVPPGENYQRVTAGGNHSCALDRDGRPVCWGYDFNGQASPPENERFNEISAGGFHTCALREDGTPRCWGWDNYGQASPPPDIVLARISSGEYHACGLTRAEGRLICWGKNLFGQASPPEHDGFVQLDSGEHHGCAVHENGYVMCWGGNQYGQSEVPVDNDDFVQVATGGDYSCGMRRDGSMSCWGNNEEAQAVPPQAPPNRRPSALFLDPEDWRGEMPEGALVGHLRAEDYDPGDQHHYSLVAGEGDRDNGLFRVEENRILTAVPLGVGEYRLRARADDGHNGIRDAVFLITIE